MVELEDRAMKSSGFSISANNNQTRARKLEKALAVDVIGPLEAVPSLAVVQPASQATYS